MTTAHLPVPAPAGLRSSRFSRSVLQTPGFEETKLWYQTFRSAKPMFENDVVCFLIYDEEHHRVVIGLNPDATPRDPKAAGAVHFADAVEPLEDLINAYPRLEAEGIIPHGCIGHGFTTSLYYTSLHYPDPDGNEAELQVDDDQSRESMDAWLRAGASDRNFAGQPFDPARKAELHRAGVPEERILQQELYR